MFIFKKWNGRYGNNAKFVVENEDDGKQTMFSPTRPKDVSWQKTDLTQDDEVKNWEDFGEEKVESLNDIVF